MRSDEGETRSGYSSSWRTLPNTRLTEQFVGPLRLSVRERQGGWQRVVDVGFVVVEVVDALQRELQVELAIGVLWQ